MPPNFSTAHYFVRIEGANEEMHWESDRRRVLELIEKFLATNLSVDGK
jgi:hypothetical protein